MKIILLTMVSSKETWLIEAKHHYREKINYYIPFEIEGLKSAKLDRANSEQKKKAETQSLIKYLKQDDFVILLDEKGKALSSLGLAQWMDKTGFQSQSKRLVFVIGGAFGVDVELKKRANLVLQMGPWTLNHHVAQVVLLEQIYRSMTIIKGLPYHNE